MTNKYVLIDHTADLGMEVFGDDLNQLFANAGLAFSEILTDVSKVNEIITKEIVVSENDLEQLMISWLHEILYYYEVDLLLFNKVEINSIVATKQDGVPSTNGYTLTATVSGEGFDHSKHVVLTEIKAVTHHQIEVREKDGEWWARIIFDL